MPLFLLVWNIAALNFDRGLGKSLASAFAQTQQETLIAALAARVKPKASVTEKVWQVALGGLLAVLFPSQKVSLSKVLAPYKGAQRRIFGIAMQQSFLPAYCALEGIVLYGSRARVFGKDVCQELLRKFGEYDDVGRALNELKRRVKL